MKFYQVKLESPVAPSFISGYSETYIVEDSMVEKLNLKDSCIEEVAIDVLFKKKTSIKNIEVEHTNIWDYLYKFTINKLSAEVIYFEHEGEYIRAYKPILEGFSMINDKIKELPKYRPIGTQFWGHEFFLECTKHSEPSDNISDIDNEVCSNVFFVDKKLTEAEFNVERLLVSPLNLTPVINEIIADG